MLKVGVGVAGLRDEVLGLRRSPVTVILLVYAALVLDNMLLTVVVPIIPDYLYQLEHQHTARDAYLNTTIPSTTATYKTLPKGIYNNQSTLSSRDLTSSSPKLQDRPSHSTSEASMTEIRTLPKFPTPVLKEIMAVPQVEVSSDAKPSVVSDYQSMHTKLALQHLMNFSEKINLAGNLKRYRSELPNQDSDNLTEPIDNPSEPIDNPGKRFDDLVHVKRLKMQTPKPVDNAEIHYNSLKDTQSKRSDEIKDRISHNINNKNIYEINTGEGSIKNLLQDHFLSLSGRRSKQKYKQRRDVLVPMGSPLLLLQNTHTNLVSPDTFHYSHDNVSVRQLHPGSTQVPQHSLEKTLQLANSHKTTTTHTFRDTKVNDGSRRQQEPQKVSALAREDKKLPQDIIAENGRVGLLFSSKALVQLVVNPLVGPLTAHVGYSFPLVVGTHNLILSALLFAYAESYTLMFLARSLQGVASSCIAIADFTVPAGMGIIAECYSEDEERGRIQGLVMGGIALGVLAGYPLGSFLYDFTSSKTPPFLVVVTLTALLALVQLVVLDPRPTPERVVEGTPLVNLVRDPYILVTAGAIMKWQLGTAFIPDSIGYLVGTSCTTGPAFRMGRWRAAVVAMLMVGLAAATVPEARSMLALAGPHLCLGMGVGTVDAALMPLLAALVDARHVAAYGSVYAIAQAAVALAYFLGPLVGGAVVQKIGFPWLMRSVAILNICYCPVLFFLNSFDQSATETQAILMAAPKPHDYTSHITTIVQPRGTSLMYQQLFDEEDDD
ncbi:synaptic vesicular amine transporter isoform X3 [Cherax quadricarinatus]|uniref:synaptic vesicular amine transporter isoform X3 n=1 Tax=Cherax quadricarinatus TaxID=27406 RepID=UPI00387E8069